MSSVQPSAHAPASARGNETPRKAGHKVRVLVVDDEVSARVGLKKLLELDGYLVTLAEEGASALVALEDHPPDIVLTDMKMPGIDGLTLLEAIRVRDKDLPVLVITAFGDVSSAVQAMRAGAADYLTKPIDFDVLSMSLQRALEHRDLRIEAESLRASVREQAGTGLGGLLGKSPPMQTLYRLAQRVAPSRATILITGESGTGKGELARAIHLHGSRAKAPFVSVHCAALAESLLESELFGHEKGAFTGAEKRRIGRFEQADGGTLFLDEVGDIAPATQVKLLKVLQERCFERVGGNESVSVDVRVIAATHRDLTADVRDGRFREDLFYRLNVVHLDVPPLRVREGDVITLAEHFLKRFSQENHRRIEGFTDKARARLIGHRWPGNVRELENAIERAVVMSDSSLLDDDVLPFAGTLMSQGGLQVPGSTMAEIERQAILTALEAAGGSTTKAAEMLDISVRTIQYRLHEYGVAKK